MELKLDTLSTTETTQITETMPLLPELSLYPTSVTLVKAREANLTCP